MSPHLIKRLLVLLPLLVLVALGTVSSRPIASPSLLPPVAQSPYRLSVAGPIYQPINATNAGLNQAAQSALPFLPYLQLEPQVNLRQTVGDYTVTVYRIYADANQVILAYALTGEQTIDPTIWLNATLTDAGGTVFELTSATDTSATNPHSYLATFDTPVWDDISTTLDLHLRFSVNRLAEDRQSIKEQTRPFDFTFTAPVRSAATRVLDLNQTVKPTVHIGYDTTQLMTGTGVVPMTLERLIVTPGAARAILHYDLTALQPRQGYGYSDGVGTIPSADLLIGHTAGYSYAENSPMRDLPQRLSPPPLSTDWFSFTQYGTYRWSYTVYRTFADQGGEGLLSVSELYDLSSINRLPPPTVTGPWTFHFTVPPLVQ